MHWSDQYVGMAYVDNEFDCAALAALVRAEVFGQPVDVPTERAGLRAGTRTISDLKEKLADPVVSPMDGDAALMCCGRLYHVGVVCIIAGRTWILHNLRNAGQVVRHEVRELAQNGLKLEGYYRWR